MWQESLFSSLQLANAGLTNLAGEHFNCKFYIESYESVPQNPVTPTFDANGNYTVNTEVNSTILEVKARLRQSRPELQLAFGLNTQTVYFEGRLTNPLLLPRVVRSSEEIEADIDGVRGSFTFLPQFSNPATIIGGISGAIGQRVRGYFKVGQN